MYTFQVLYALTSSDLIAPNGLRFSEANLDAQSRRSSVGQMDPKKLEFVFEVASLEMKECGNISHLCLLLVDDETASYTEMDLGNNFRCIAIEDIKVCDPGNFQDILATLF